MKKVIRNNQVAVLISPGYGAGWYSWHAEHEELLYHPKLVEMVEQKRANEIDTDWIESNLGIKNVYCGGARSLQIHWLTVGTEFIIDEYDGFESIITELDFTLTA